MTVTSSSDRYAKAREALERYDGGEPMPWSRLGDDMADALRSLIEPPPTTESPEQIAGRIMVEQVGEADPTAEYTTDGAEILRMIAVGIHAGIQAAWESWEPESGFTVDEAETILQQQVSDEKEAE